jgi:hypothetical protein
MHHVSFIILMYEYHDAQSTKHLVIIIITIFLHGLGRLTCSGIFSWGVNEVCS